MYDDLSTEAQNVTQNAFASDNLVRRKVAQEIILYGNVIRTGHLYTPKASHQGAGIYKITYERTNPTII